MAGIGILGLVQGDFTPTWSGVPKTVPAREAIAYLCAIISLGAGAGLLWRRGVLNSARLLVLTFLAWMLVIRVPVIVKYPTITGAWWALGDSAVTAGAALVLFARFAGDWDRQRFAFATGERGLRLGRLAYGLAMIPFGIAHFTYLDRTTPLVPSWLPFHTAWAYFTGAAFIAAGVAMVTGVWARLAALLSTLQMALFTVIVWVPIILATPKPSDWQEFISSWVLSACGWLVADSYRDVPWFAVGRR
jgi:uncharacterized membrane protein